MRTNRMSGTRIWKTGAWLPSDMKKTMQKRINMTPLIRLVDDDDNYRSSQSLFLRMLGWQVADYPSASAFLNDDDLGRPGCLILDIRMPGMTGLELQRELIERGAKLPIIFLTGHGDVAAAVHALKFGAADFIEKRGDPLVFKAAVEKAVALSVSIVNKAISDAERRAVFDELTPREKDVVLAAAFGASNKDIGERYGIGLATVKMHRGNAFAKLGVQNALEAYHRLSGLGLFEGESDGEGENDRNAVHPEHGGGRS